MNKLNSHTRSSHNSHQNVQQPRAQGNAVLQEELTALMQVFHELGVDSVPTCHRLWGESAIAHPRALLTQGSSAMPDSRLGVQEAKRLIEKIRREEHQLLVQRVATHEIPYRSIPGKLVTVDIRRADVAPVTACMLEKYGFGYCTEVNDFVYLYLKKHLPVDTSVEFCKVQGGDHGAVVVGRRPHSDPDDSTQWGDAWIVDAWANRIYPISEFRTMQHADNDVKRVGDAHSAPHYLDGQWIIAPQWLPLTMQQFH